MLDELVKQVRRLFSSKNNGGRLVYNLTDWFHFITQTVLALSIILVTGYGQFREHMKCQGSDKIDSKTVTNHCWTNGTTTFGLRDEFVGETASLRGRLPHIGLVFSPINNNGKYEYIMHNYMHSSWALLLFLVVFSYVALRYWCKIFDNDIMRALLKLPGYQELAIVKKAQEIQPYQVLMSLKTQSGSQAQPPPPPPPPPATTTSTRRTPTSNTTSTASTCLAESVTVTLAASSPSSAAHLTIPLLDMSSGGESSSLDLPESASATCAADNTKPVESNKPTATDSTTNIRPLPPVKPIKLSRNKNNEPDAAATQSDYENDEKIYARPKRQQKLATASVSALQQQHLTQLFHGHPIESLVGEQNEYNHTLDYYVNQALYMIVACRSSLSGEKLSDLNLKWKLISNSLISTSVSLFQFIVCWIVIGDRYGLYGWRMARAWYKYILEQLMNPSSIVNSVDYELSAHIWPITTSCMYSQYGLQGEERMTFTCSVPINEICGKTFMILWWLFVVQIICNLWSLFEVCMCSSSDIIMKWHFERNYWPKARKEARYIATFNYRHWKLLNKSRFAAMARSTSGEGGASEKAKLAMNNNDIDEQMTFAQIFDALRKKFSTIGNLTGHGYKKSSPMIKEDINIYFYLSLLYFRLGKDEKKVEQIVLMISNALKVYYESLIQLQMKYQIE